MYDSLLRNSSHEAEGKSEIATSVADHTQTSTRNTASGDHFSEAPDGVVVDWSNISQKHLPTHQPR